MCVRKVGPSSLLTLTFVVAWALGGCDGDSGGGGEGEGERPDAGVEADATPDQGPAEQFPAERFSLLFVGEQREPSQGALPTMDLYLADDLDQELFAELDEQEDELPAERTVNLTEGTLRCEYCQLSPDHAWLAWAERSEEGNVTVQVAPVDAGYVVNQTRKLSVHVFSGTEALDELVFAGNRLIYGSLVGHEVQVVAYDLQTRTERTLGTMPDGGSLRPSLDGTRLVLQEKVGLTELRLRLVDLTDPASTPQLVQAFTVEGTTTGSDYTGNERSAISPDGRYMALLTEARPSLGQSAEFRLSIVSLDLAAPGLTGYYKIGDAGQAGCQKLRGPDEYTYSSADPVWSPDGRSVYVLGMTPANCSVITMSVNESDVLRFSVLEDGRLVDGLENVTANPRQDWPVTLAMEALALSPEGKYLVVVAPHGNRFQDREIYLFSAKLAQLRNQEPVQLFRDLRLQLTNDAKLLIGDFWLFPKM